MPKLGIICGLRFEAAIVRGASQGLTAHKTPLVACSGPGPEQAGKTASKLINEGAEALLSFGLAGGLDPNLKTGTVIIPSELAGNGAPPCDSVWAGRLEIALKGLFKTRYAPLMAVKDVVTTIEEKRALFESSGAAVVDMESYGIAEEAGAKSIPFTALRVICDTADEVIPPVALQGMAWTGEVRVTATVLEALAHPIQIPDLVRLGRRTASAKSVLRNLAGFCAERSFFAFG